MNELKDVLVHYEQRGGEVRIQVRADVPELLTAVELLLRTAAEQLDEPVQKLLRLLNLGMAANTVKLKKEEVHGEDPDALR